MYCWYFITCDCSIRASWSFARLCSLVSNSQKNAPIMPAISSLLLLTYYGKNFASKINASLSLSRLAALGLLWNFGYLDLSPWDLDSPPTGSAYVAFAPYITYLLCADAFICWFNYFSFVEHTLHNVMCKSIVLLYLWVTVATIRRVLQNWLFDFHCSSWLCTHYCIIGCIPYIT